MDISQSELAWLYLYALLLGGGLGALYDALRMTRIFLGVHYSRYTAKRLRALRLPLLKPQKKRAESRALGIVIFFEDFLFCTVAGFSLILLFYEANNGKLRFPVLLCAGVGFLLYRGTLGRLVMLLSEAAVFLIETAFRYILFVILFPFRIAGKWLQIYIRRAIGCLARAHSKKMRRKYTATQSTRSVYDACGLVPGGVPQDKNVKRGKKIAQGKKKTVQPHTADARSSRRYGGGVHRRVCK